MESLEDRASIFLEEMYISGDTMVDMNHNIEDLDPSKIGAMYLHDILAAFVVYSNERDSQKKDIYVANCPNKETNKDKCQWRNKTCNICDQ